MARVLTLQQQYEASSIAATNLTRLLSRLDDKLATPLEANARSSLEQAKLAVNLEYARQLLHQIESSTNLITVPAKKQKAMADLGTQKQIIRRLNESLHAASAGNLWDEAAQESGQSDDDVPETPGGENAEEDDDDYARLKRPQKQKPVRTPEPEPEAPKAATTASSTPAPTSTIRNRFATKSGEDAKKAALFGKAGQMDPDAGTEQVLDMQRQQQEDITSDLLNMAKLLKESSVDFAKNLEDEKGYLDMAKEGLDKNAMGMDATGRRLEDLRKNDSVSYMWSMIYLSSIILLAFLTLFVLFFAPKLRWW